MREKLHWLNLVLDELVEPSAVNGAKAVEAGTADHLLLEASLHVGAVLGPNEHPDFADAAQREEDLLQQHLPQEASGTSYEHTLARVPLCYWHKLIKLFAY